MSANPWALDEDDRAEAARMLEEYANDVEGPGVDEHPLRVAHDHMLVACHVTGEVEVGLIVRAAFMAMKYGGEEARDRLMVIMAQFALEYEPPDPRRN